MKRLTLFLMLIFSFSVVSGIRINEIEANPAGSDSANEWIELYSQEEVSIDGWKVVRGDNSTRDINGNFTGFLTINFSTQWVRNSLEAISLVNINGTIIDAINSINDSEDNNKTWQYCDNNWRFSSNTRGMENNCTLTNNYSTNNEANSTNQTTNQTQNNTQPINNTNNSSQNQTITTTIKINFPKSIRGGNEEEFFIEMLNLDNDYYDLKLIINDGEGNTLSEVDDGGVWKNSFYYIEEFARGPGNKNATAILRIKEEYLDINGNYTIFAKLRKKNSASYTQIEGKIEVLAMKEKKGSNEEKNGELISEKINNSKKRSENKGAVLLNYDTAQSIKSGIIYESKNQKVRNYVGYAFAVLCVLIIAFLLIKQKNGN